MSPDSGDDVGSCTMVNVEGRKCARSSPTPDLWLAQPVEGQQATKRWMIRLNCLIETTWEAADLSD
jgi:hypothetical protein